MTTVSELLSANLHGVFGNRDAEARRERIETIYTEDVVFTDPEGTVRGRASIEQKAAELLAGAPDDFVFAEDGERYVGADIGALAWAFGPAGAPVARGIDVLTVANGQITSVRTFFIDTATQ
jgi:ketosteroid isomerase-like protein